MRKPVQGLLKKEKEPACLKKKKNLHLFYYYYFMAVSLLKIIFKGYFNGMTGRETRDSLYWTQNAAQA